MPPQNPPRSPHKPFVVKSTAGRDITIAVIAGVVLLGVVLWGIMHMSQDVAGHSPITGTIVSKHFEPQQQEEQVTIGRGGLNERNVDGVYTMVVTTGEGRTYTVFVEKPVYESHKVGDGLTFMPPRPKTP